MEPEFSGISGVKMVAKNIMLGSPGNKTLIKRPRSCMRVDESPNLWETITERETSRVIGLIHNCLL